MTTKIRDGYKQTEVGVIPEDWGLKRLAEVTTLMTNGFVGIATIHYSNDDSAILYIQGYNVEENGYNFRGIKYVTKAFHKLHQKSCLQENDLLTIQTGDVGLTTIVPLELVGSNCHALIITRFKKENIFPKFCSYYFNSSKGRARLKEIETGTTMKHINVGDLLQFEIPLPPSKSEQTAIATALSDADALITSLEKLIEKKRAMKQGAMQELLKPKEGWVVCNLSEAVDFLDGQRRPIKSNDRKSGEYPYYGASGIIDYVNNFIFDDELILLGEDGENILSRNLPLAFMVSGKIWINNHAHVLKPKEQFDIKYLTYFLESLDYSLLNSGTAQPKLNKLACLNIKVTHPSKEEQIRIATILSNMDSEITALEQKLGKFRMIKQGMMQELLTGRIRLMEKVGTTDVVIKGI